MAHKLSRILDYLPMKRDIERSDLEWLRNVAKTAENAAPVVNGKVPAKYIPEYFNDIVDFPSKDDFPAAGEAGKFYVDSSDGAVYRWNPQAGGGAGGYVPSPDPLTADVADLKARGYVKDSSGTVVAVVGSGSGSEVELQAKLTIDSEPTSGSDHPVSSGGVKAALANVDAKPTRIYNSTGTDALDDKGQLFKSSLSGNFFVESNTWTYPYYGVYGSGSSLYYRYGANDNDHLRYYPSDGILRSVEGYWRARCTPGLDPTVPGTDLSPQQEPGQSAYTFTPLNSTMEETTPYARFALESMPTAWAANTAYTVGVCASSGGKAYRCKTAHTSGAEFDASKWDEVPVLKLDDSMPAEPSDAQLAEAVKKLWVHLGGTLSS